MNPSAPKAFNEGNLNGSWVSSRLVAIHSLIWRKSLRRPVALGDIAISANPYLALVVLIVNNEDAFIVPINCIAPRVINLDRCPEPVERYLS